MFRGSDNDNAPHLSSLLGKDANFKHRSDIAPSDQIKNNLDWQSPIK